MAAKNRYEKTYTCTNCGADVDDRDQLTVKKVEFRAMGSKARTFKSRVLHWLCPACLKKDTEWNLDPYTDPSERQVTTGPGQLSLPVT